MSKSTYNACVCFAKGIFSSSLHPLLRYLVFKHWTCRHDKCSAQVLVIGQYNRSIYALFLECTREPTGKDTVESAFRSEKQCQHKKFGAPHCSPSVQHIRNLSPLRPKSGFYCVFSCRVSSKLMVSNGFWLLRGQKAGAPSIVGFVLCKKEPGVPQLCIDINKLVSSQLIRMWVEMLADQWLSNQNHTCCQMVDSTYVL